MEPVKEENNQDKSTLNQEDYSIDHDHLNNSDLQNNSSMLKVDSKLKKPAENPKNKSGISLTNYNEEAV